MCSTSYHCVQPRIQQESASIYFQMHQRWFPRANIRYSNMENLLVDGLFCIPRAQCLPCFGENNSESFPHFIDDRLWPLLVHGLRKTSWQPFVAFSTLIRTIPQPKIAICRWLFTPMKGMKGTPYRFFLTKNREVIIPRYFVNKNLMKYSQNRTVQTFIQHSYTIWRFKTKKKKKRRKKTKPPECLSVKAWLLPSIVGAHLKLRPVNPSSDLSPAPLRHR